MPPNVPVPFRDYLGTTRFDWTQSTRSQWFLRAATDNYHTRERSGPAGHAALHRRHLGLTLLELARSAINSPSAPLGWDRSRLSAGSLHHTEARNSNLGFALAFPFSSTSSTISGFETFGDNQFVTPITAFPVLRNQEKYQFRYDVSHVSGRHAPRFGVDLIHEPVMSGALSGTAEKLTVFPLNPVDYLGNPQQFSVDLSCGADAPLPGTTCADTPAANGSFSQNLQRLGFYAQDSWRVTPHLIVNYGLRYDTTFGLFTASGRSQLQNPALLTLEALHIPLSNGSPHDYRGASAPRLGIAYSPGQSGNTVIRAGIGKYYNDLAQNGWVTAFQAVNRRSGAVPCRWAIPDAFRAPRRGRRGADRSALQDSLCPSRQRRRPARLQFPMEPRRRLGARAGSALLRALPIPGGIHAVLPAVCGLGLLPAR